MKLYHATSLDRGELINSERAIKGSHVDRIYKNLTDISRNGYKVNLNTTDGYVYMGEFIWALEFGNVTACMDNNNYIYIYEIEIPIELLEADLDQISVHNIYEKNKRYINSPVTALESYNFCSSVRFKGNINFDQYSVRFANVKSTNHCVYKHLADYLSLRYSSSEKTNVEKIESLYQMLAWTEL